MAAAVILNVPLVTVVRRRLADVAGIALSDEEYTSFLAAARDSTTTTALYEYVGDGLWRWSSFPADDNLYLASASFTGATDHFYLVHPRGTMQAFTAIRTASTSTAHATPSSVNLATTLTDAAGAFTTPTAVAAGDTIIATLSGATAKVLTVDSATQLTTTPLSDGATYATGFAYRVGRMPGTDTTAQYTVTVRRTDVTQMYLEILRQHKTRIAMQPDISVGSASMNVDPRYSRLEREIGLLEGVRSA